MVDQIREGNLEKPSGKNELIYPESIPDLLLAFESLEQSQVDRGVHLALELLNNDSIKDRLMQNI